jgi:hypothetical protein
MKFTQTGTFKENYLEEQVTIKPMERIQDVRHPPKEFWDNFEAGKEEEARKYYK